MYCLSRIIVSRFFIFYKYPIKHTAMCVYLRYKSPKGMGVGSTYPHFWGRGNVCECVCTGIYIYTYICLYVCKVCVGVHICVFLCVCLHKMSVPDCDHPPPPPTRHRFTYICLYVCKVCVGVHICVFLCVCLHKMSVPDCDHPPPPPNSAQIYASDAYTHPLKFSKSWWLRDAFIQACTVPKK